MENGTTYTIADTKHYIAIMKGKGTAYWKKLKIKAL